jgi:D-glycero-alpha-D-manno-heptose 1-phosphate guanylyltransferase
MKLLVLAGGFGTRLQTAVTAVPKALAPVGNMPFLHLQIAHWRSQGINSFAFLLHHQSSLIINFLQKEQKIGLLMDCKVQCLVEPTPMDTGGAVAYAVDQLGLTDNFLVTNADTWLGSGIANVAQAKSPAMAVVKLSDSARYGSVQFDEQHLVTAFQEKNCKGQGSDWINAGLCQLNAASFKDWDHLPFSLERVTFPAMVARRELTAVALQTDFIDIGVPDDYYHFCGWIASDRKGTLWS